MRDCYHNYSENPAVFRITNLFVKLYTKQAQTPAQLYVLYLSQGM